MLKEDNDEQVDYDDDELEEYDDFDLLESAEYSNFQTSIDKLNSLVYMKNSLKIFSDNYSKEFNNLMSLLSNDKQVKLKNIIDSVN